MRCLSFLIFIVMAGSLLAQSPHGKSIGDLDCSSCHVSSTWIVDKNKTDFNHDQTNFKLIGQHKLLDCRSCHKNLIFSKAQSECNSCHTDIHQNTVGFTCEKCHTPETWIVKNIKLVHQQSRFPLVGVHQSIDCRQCHKQYDNLNFQPVGASCYSCHSLDYANAKNPNHIVSGFSTDCESCHSLTSKFWIAQNFQHDFFPLSGGHKIDNCFSCHKQGTFAGLSKVCVSCHLTNYNKTTNPNHSALGLSTDCQACHNTIAFVPASFNHSATGFTLTGKHLAITCVSCHSGTAALKTDCLSCHKSNYDATTNPPHASIGFGTDCQTCHSTIAFIPASFNHSNTGFSLTGKHISISCNSCHIGTAIPKTDCYSCHKTNYDNTTNPHHVTTGFGTDCQTCHSTTAWQPATFNHDQAFFPIYSGSHNGRWNVCADCHTVSTNYTVFSCMTGACHPKSSTDNTHSGVQGYSYVATQCYACHPIGSSGGFNHAVSPFPLTGMHTTVDCIQCHQNGYPNTPTSCASCHQSNYNATVNPNHKTLLLPTDCGSCHSTVAGWKPAAFPVHNNYFSLLGAHATTATCINCHNGNYNNTPNQCVGCHLNSYNSSLNPKHQPAGISTTCQTCHNSTAWIPSQFVHTTTGFTLTGVHATIQCSSCHIGTTSGLNSLCVSCHLSNYNSASNHVSQNYPSTCEMCHNTTDWSQSTFNHQTTPFPLTGVHTTVTCNNCHQNGFTIPTTCASCHQSNYNTTTNPNHLSLALATTCETCHSTNLGWKPASFSVHNNYYVLAGAHTSLTCLQCHNGNYSSTSIPTDCYSCHIAKYNNTTNPNHSAAQFPHECQTCHSQTAWTPSTFNHDQAYFPIYSGSHLNRWTLCSQCHQVSTNFVTFTCMSSGCHSQSSTDSQHAGVSGYSYIANACYTCHPNGGGGGKSILRPPDRRTN